METKNTLLCSLVIIALAFTGLQKASGQQYDKTFKWNYNTNEDTRVILNNYDTDLEVHTWSKNQVEFQMIIKAEIRSAKDADDLDEYLSSLDFFSSPTRTEIDAKFWKNRANIMGFSRMTVNGSSINYQKFDMKCILWLPEKGSLELRSKYAEIHLEDIGGNLNMDLYNDEITGGSVSGSTEITAKYTEMSFSDMQDIKADFYDCEVKAGDIGDLEMVTKYSEFDIGNAGNLIIDSYEDEIYLNNCGDIKFIAKYSELNVEKAGSFVADNYECEFLASIITDAEIKSKYSDYEITIGEDVKISSSYEDSFSAGRLESLYITETKYGEYELIKLEKSLKIISAYEDEISIEELQPALESASIEGRYLEIDLGVPESLECRLLANIKYPGLDIDEDLFRTKKHIKDSSQLEYEGIKGTEKEGMTTIKVTGYEVNLEVSEY